MGLDLTLVDLRLQDFICAICLEFPVKPYECKHCKQLFCETCLATWRRTHPQTCPLRCALPRYARIKDTFERILSNVRVKCRYHTKGCTETRSCQDIQVHEEHCTAGRAETMELDDSPSLKTCSDLSIEEVRYRQAYANCKSRRPLSIEIPCEETQVFQPAAYVPTPRVIWTGPYLDWGQGSLMMPPTPVYLPVRYAPQSCYPRVSFN